MFQARLHLQIHMPTSSLYSYLAASAKSASHCFGKLWLWGELPCISYNVYGPFGEHLGRPEISAGTLAPSLFCWPNLGCKSPLAETPKGSVCWDLPASAVVKQSPWMGGNRGSVQRILGRERAYIGLWRGLTSSLPQGREVANLAPTLK